MLKGEIYPSISEASRQTNHSRDTIRRWLKDPDNKNCELIDANKPHEPVLLTAGKEDKSWSLPKDSEQINTGLPKNIILDGIFYPSIAEAARKLNCSRANIQRRLNTDKKNCFFL
jgi:DNA invertase Pin-like site-specific DNA recombinase